MVDLGIRLASRSALLEVNGRWLSLDLSSVTEPGHLIRVEFGRVKDSPVPVAAE